MSVRIRFFITTTLMLLWVSLSVFGGCSHGAKYCSTSPVDIEETLSDSRDLDKDLAKVRDRLATAQGDLARWKTRLADRRTELPQLEDELATLKKKSGVTEEMVADVKPKKPEEEKDEIQLMPPGGVTGGHNQNQMD